MIKKLTLATGIGVGYVLGSRAGRKQYNALATKAQDVWNNPQTQRALGAATSAVADHAPGIAGKAGAKAHELSTKAADKARQRGNTGAAEGLDAAGKSADQATRNAGDTAAQTAAQTRDRSTGGQPSAGT